MRYEKSMLTKWNEYANLKGAEHQGLQQGIQQGKEEERRELNTIFVTNLLTANKFTISEIANFANVSEAFVRSVKRNLNKRNS